MKKQSNYFLHCYIAGLPYYKVLEVWKKLEIRQLLDLIPESLNRYDAYASFVAFKGKKLNHKFYKLLTMLMKHVSKVSIHKTLCMNGLKLV